MDVRCEKCMTVYEFDDSKVGEQGVTVKCTQCGNLFKVKRRERTAELAMGSAAARSPAYIQPGASSADRSTKPGIAVLATASQPTTPRPAAPQAKKPEPKEPEAAGWMIRRASGEVFRFRELTTLQQWIVERKVTREDEISRSGEQWKRLGGIAELASFFHVVEQAAAVARTDEPRAAAPANSEDLALVTTAPMVMPSAMPAAMPAIERSGPTAMGNPVEVDDPAFARTSPKPKLTPSTVPALPDDDDEDDDDFEPRRRRRGGLWAGVLAALVVAGAGGYLAMFQRDGLRGLFSRSDGRVDEAYRQGREYFLLDSDDAFRNAVAAFARAREADPKAALPLAGMAEVKATWASYLRDDARALEGNGATVTTQTAANTLRREAQADLDDAKRAVDDALNLAPDAPEVNRAMAEYLLVDGAQAAEVQRYLERVTAKKPADPETAYVAGALAYREGQRDDAKAKLTQAIQLNQQATQHALLRASYLLARVEAEAGDKAAAKQALQPVLAVNAQHDRARALMQTLAASEGGRAEPSAAKRPPSTQPVAPAAATAPSGVAVSGAAQKPDKLEKPEDYAGLVAQGDHLSENGHARDARHLYERALQQQPNGLEAITGIGYCDLDGERFSSAVDQFKRALSVRPGYGDALIGLAEAYKLRGDRSEAVKWYKAYLDKQPNGPKAAMAKNNIRDLEPRPVSTTTEVKEVPPPSPEAPRAVAPAPPTEAAPRTDDSARDDSAKTPRDDSAKTPDEPKPDDKPTPLPRLPSSDQPPQ